MRSKISGSGSRIVQVMVLNKTSNRLMTSSQLVSKMRQRGLRLLGFGGRSIDSTFPWRREAF
jgi:hypothetical protein